MDQTTIAPEYRLPPGEIAAILDAPTSPEISVDPDGRWMLVLTKPSLPPISEWPGRSCAWRACVSTPAPTG